MITRNTTIPTKKSEIFTTQADNQPSVEIHVLQGERKMARDNKTIGKFMLDGIPPAAARTPQIEVTFDLDANGILNVKAKDLGTGKEQKITITASSGLSKDEIERMVKDAEAHADEDAKKKEAIEIRNKAEQMVYQVEKSLKEAGDKISADKKAPVEKAIEDLKEALKGDDVDAIKAKEETLTKEMQAIAQELYANAAPNGAGASGGAPTGDAGCDPNCGSDCNSHGDASSNGKDDIIDADFTMVDDKDKKK